jgi:hypothetical protein
MTKHWLAVASRDHMRHGVEGGFCQLGHGKEAPIRRLSTGDRIAYYSPKVKLEGGDPVQARTAIGTIKSGEAYCADMGQGFRPWRRAVTWNRKAHEAPIRPLLSHLELTKSKASWGIVFRRSLSSVSPPDFNIIAKAMSMTPAAERLKEMV